MLSVLLCGSAFRFMAGYTISSYMAVYYNRFFPERVATFSALNAVVVSVGGMASSYCGARWAEAWERAGNPRARLLVPTFGALCVVPIQAVTLYASNFWVSIVFYFLHFLLAECWMAPAISVIQRELPTQLRGTAIAVFTIVTTFAGSLAVYLVGVADTHDGDLRWDLTVSTCGSYAVSGVFFFIASQMMSEKPPRGRRPLRGGARGGAAGGEGDGEQAEFEPLMSKLSTDNLQGVAIEAAAMEAAATAAAAEEERGEGVGRGRAEGGENTQTPPPARGETMVRHRDRQLLERASTKADNSMC